MTRTQRSDVLRSRQVYLFIKTNWSYPGHGIISKKNSKLFEAWDRADPVDAWEIERCKRIEAVQGNKKPFVMTLAPT
jgi:deoxyribonuclease-1